tara:strand:- start:99 stop:713 length:615 start_codon:yes stop_codon:yes gene_type:complete
MAISEQLENENKGLDLLAQSAERGRPIPGQSLTNDPDQAYNWERPPEIVTLQDGILDIFRTLIKKEVFTNLVGALRKGVPVEDIGSSILYNGFLNGKWNPDLMILLVEPSMYIIMAIGERAGLEDMRIYAGEELDEGGLDAEQNITNLNKISSFAALKPDKQKITKEAIPAEILEKIEQIDVSSLLDRQVVEEEDINPQSLLAK